MTQTSTTSPKQIKKAQLQARRDRINDELTTQNLMATPEGRRWVWRRLEEAAIFHEGIHDNALEMAYDKGKKNWGLRLLDDVTKFCPSEYILMTNEAQVIQSTINEEEPNYVGSPDDTDD